jgi:CO/xanthine dehydrogenase FAD-binding subunit
MPQIKAYHRPTDVNEALRLLARPGITTAVIGGGTAAVPHLAQIDEVVDLQAVGLNQVSFTGPTLTLGAMVRLQTIVDDEQTPNLLRESAHREGPNTLRHTATIGGVVVSASPESELLAALLIFEAEVMVQTSRDLKRFQLADFLADVPAALAGGLVTQVSLVTSGQTASDRVARTPADMPIVAALARRDNDQTRLALCSVAKTPILVDPEQVAAGLNPPDDFRGSSEYRRQMAVILAQRVVNQVRGLAKK